MAGEQFVGVTYRGLEVAGRTRLSELGPSTGYLELASPFPVGSELSISTDTGVSFPVSVIRVHEQVAGSERPAGVRVRKTGGGSDADAWWRAQASQDEDPDIPTRSGMVVVDATGAEAASGEASAAADDSAADDSAADDSAADDSAADDSAVDDSAAADEPAEAPNGRRKRGRRKGKRR